jgi:hypothetical protein
MLIVFLEDGQRGDPLGDGYRLTDANLFGQTGAMMIIDKILRVMGMTSVSR